MACSIAEVVGALTDRWGLLIMRDLVLGLSRYDDIRRSTGITNATLADRLRGLEAAGLVERRRYQTRPERYEYRPSVKGRDLALLMQALVQIGDKWRRDGGQEEPLRFIDQSTGHGLKLVTVDTETGAILANPKIDIEAGTAADEPMVWRLTRGAERRNIKTCIADQNSLNACAKPDE